MDPKRQKIYDKLITFSRLIGNLDATKGSFVRSQSWKILTNYINKNQDSDQKQAYIDLYLKRLEPFIVDMVSSVVNKVPLNERIEGAIANSLSNPNIPTHKTNLINVMYEISSLNSYLEFRSRLESTKVTRGVDSKKKVVLFITVGDQKHTVILSRESQRIISQNAKHVLNYIREWITLDWLSYQDQIDIYREMARQDLASAFIELVTPNFLNSASFMTLDPYLETAMYAALMTVDDSTINDFDHDLVREFPDLID